jgi:hypothetical protein
MLTRLANALLKPFKKKIVPWYFDQLIYQHDYGREGYERYRELQIFHNKLRSNALGPMRRHLSTLPAICRRKSDRLRAASATARETASNRGASRNCWRVRSTVRRSRIRPQSSRTLSNGTFTIRRTSGLVISISSTATLSIRRSIPVRLSRLGLNRSTPTQD